LSARSSLHETCHVCHVTWAHLNGVVHKSLPSVCVTLCISPIVARQRLVKNVNAETNTHARIEEFLDAFFSMWPVSYHRKVDN
jgi:hypothetical protein